MGERSKVHRVLVDHFFRRFFDSDTVQVEGETLTTVVRAVAIVAVPGLMIAFFLQNQYPQRTLWGSIEDQYFFVLYSFVVMAAVAIFQWEMLFADRLDFLVLSPLPLRLWQLLAAKVSALIGFLVLFLVSCNGFGALVLPAVSKGHFYRQVYAHVVAVSLAGVFAAAFFLALSGVLLCVLDAARFRRISPFVQMLSVTGLVSFLLGYAKLGDSLQVILSEPLGWARWMPPVWFLGIYEELLHGDAAPAFAHRMAGYGFRAAGIALLLVLVTYPVAWARMRKLAFEGAGSGQGGRSRWLGRWVLRWMRRPAERAMFAFIGRTMTRNNRYQMYLAMYCGIGLALAMACAVTFRIDGLRVQPVLSVEGLHAVLPLLLFWLIAGMRMAFAFPLSLAAGWIFRISGVSVKECARAGQRFVFGGACVLLLLLLMLLAAAGWSLRVLLVQALVGLCLCLLLTDGFFLGRPGVPFNQPRMPGKTSLPLMLTMYIGVFPVFIYGVIALEMHEEKNLRRLAFLLAGAVVFHVAARLVGDRPEEIEEEMEGYEGEFQLLGLS